MRLQRFLLEVLRLLADLRIAVDVELAKAADRFAIEAALPSMLKDPLLQLRLPVGAGGKDAAGKRKILRVEFEDGEIGEPVLIRIEELVIEDAAGLARLLAAEDPLLVRPQKGLRRSAFDDAAQRLLATVRAGKVRLVEKEKGNSDDRRRPPGWAPSPGTG